MFVALAGGFLFGGEFPSPDRLTTALVTLISGFVAHFAGGYMVAILGSLFVVATAGVFLVEGGIAIPP